MSKKVEQVRKSLVEAGFYSAEDINKICELEDQYEDECEHISEMCEEEGYPSNGSNYELRCLSIREYYDEQIAIIDNKYEL